METIRTFIAVELPDALKRSISGLQHRADLPKGIKWVDPGNIHVTIKFLGQTGPDNIRDVCRMFENHTLSFKKFRVHVAGLGAFPGTGNPKVIWAGFKDSGMLPMIYSVFEDGLATSGVSREKRPFSPHLTIARLRDPGIKKEVRAFLDKHRDIDMGSFEMERICFFKSDLTPSGPVYSVIKTINLA